MKTESLARWGKVVPVVLATAVVLVGCNRPRPRPPTTTVGPSITHVTRPPTTARPTTAPPSTRPATTRPATTRPATTRPTTPPTTRATTTTHGDHEH